MINQENSKRLAKLPAFFSISFYSFFKTEFLVSFTRHSFINWGNIKRDIIYTFLIPDVEFIGMLKREFWK